MEAPTPAAVIRCPRLDLSDPNGSGRRRLPNTCRRVSSSVASPIRVPVALHSIKEIEAAGFEFVDLADLHFRPDDELRYEVGRKSVTGNTDRWTLKFRKPAD